MIGSQGCCMLATCRSARSYGAGFRADRASYYARNISLLEDPRRGPLGKASGEQRGTLGPVGAFRGYASELPRLPEDEPVEKRGLSIADPLNPQGEGSAAEGVSSDSPLCSYVNWGRVGKGRLLGGLPR
jgi:hypothetical protein